MSIAEIALPVRPGEHACCRLRPARGPYLPDGAFELNRMHTLVRSEHRQALADGFTGLAIPGGRCGHLRGHTGQTVTIADTSDAVQRIAALLAWDTDPDVELPVAA